MVSYFLKVNGGGKVLKKILSQSLLEVSVLKGKNVLTPSKKTELELYFQNKTEYDMPLSVDITMPTGINVDNTFFDITVPAFGNTKKTLVFDVKASQLMFFGNAFAEISAFDRVLETKDVFELCLCTEMCYRCDDKENLFSRNGFFYVNCNEKATMHLATVKTKEISVVVLQGKIGNMQHNSEYVKNIDKITLTEGVNSIVIEPCEDLSFCFAGDDLDKAEFINTLNEEKFAEVK